MGNLLISAHFSEWELETLLSEVEARKNLFIWYFIIWRKQEKEKKSFKSLVRKSEKHIEDALKKMITGQFNTQLEANKASNRSS